MVSEGGDGVTMLHDTKKGCGEKMSIEKELRDLIMNELLEEFGAALLAAALEERRAVLVFLRALIAQLKGTEWKDAGSKAASDYSCVTLELVVGYIENGVHVGEPPVLSDKLQ